MPAAPHPFNDTSAGAFDFGYVDKDGLAVSDSAGALLHSRLMQRAPKAPHPLTLLGMKALVANYSSCQIHEIILESLRK